MMNKVILVGRIANDFELKELNKDTKVINFSLAVNRGYKNENGESEVDFINCSIWNKIAENMKEYTKKGDLVGVEGRLSTSTYEKDEVKHYKTEVMVDKIIFLGSKKGETEEKVEA